MSTKSIGVKAGTGIVPNLAPRWGTLSYNDRLNSETVRITAKIKFNENQRKPVKQFWAFIGRLYASSNLGIELSSISLQVSPTPDNEYESSINIWSGVGMNVDLTKGTSYTLKGYLVNGFTGSPSSPPSPTIPDSPETSLVFTAGVQPAVPNSVSLSGSFPNLTTTYTFSPANDGGLPITGYTHKIFKEELNANLLPIWVLYSTNELTNTSTSQSQYTHNTGAGKFYVTIAAKNAAGTGPALQSATYTVPAPPFFPPFFPYFPPFFPFFPFFPSFSGGCCPSFCVPSGGFCTGCECLL